MTQSPVAPRWLQVRPTFSPVVDVSKTNNFSVPRSHEKQIIELLAAAKISYSVSFDKEEAVFSLPVAEMPRLQDTLREWRTTMDSLHYHLNRSIPA